MTIKIPKRILTWSADGKRGKYMRAMILLKMLAVAKLNIHHGIMIIALLSIFSCQTESPKSKEKLEVVTYKQFSEFVKKTGYVTDVEKFGWSIVQKNVFEFIKVDDANWRKPDGKNKPKSENLPVTQVSYNDAIAYCQWSDARLPSYNEYWELIKDDKHKIITNNIASISAANNVNILGNVWEITSTEKGNEIRLAGGSLFCSPNKKE